MTTKKYGQETSWTLGTCSNESPHVSYRTVAVQCCLAPGEYTLDCKDSHGDGWDGGYVKIDGKKYCEKFENGKSETHEVIVGPDTVPDEDDEEWVEGKSCSSDRVGTLFCTRGMEKEEYLETLKEECLVRCNANDNCKFASLFLSSDQSNLFQCCWSYGAGCGPTVPSGPERYRLYIKP
jgi:hypothetical protein